MNRLRAAAVMIAALCAAAAVLSSARAEEGMVDTLDASVYNQDIEALTRYPHRMAGVGEYTEQRQNALAPYMGDPPVEAQARSEELEDQIERLLELADNPDYIVPGPGSLAASVHIQRRLKGIAGAHGLDASQFRVFTQEFDVVLPITIECRLFVDGQEVMSDTPGQAALYATRPNALMAPVTPAAGLEGPSLYAGRGRLEDYDNNDISGRIVILDYDGDWRIPFAFGAKAVIIIGPRDPQWPATLHAFEPANLPRFYVTPEMAEQLDLTGESRVLRVQAACQWRRFRGRNVIAVLRGTNPRFDTTSGPRQTLVLAAPLDSLSEVPALSPGARDAANCAAMLQLVEYLSVNRPRRDIVFAFLDGQSQCHMGARAFYSAIHRPLDREYSGPEGLTNKTTGQSFAEREEALTTDLEFQAYAIQILRQDNIYEPDTIALKAERDELVSQLGANPLLEVGPLLAGPWHILLTIVLCLLAVMLTMLDKHHASADDSPGVPAVAVARKLATLVGALMAVGLAYGLILDPLAFGAMRAAQVEKGRGSQAIIDNLEQDITGLERSHRATMDLLRELAREKNSDALEQLRPLRVEMDEMIHGLDDARDQLAGLQDQQRQLADRLDAADDDQKEAIEAELSVIGARLAETQSEIDAAQAAIDKMLPRLITLTVEDMVYNSALRVIRKEWIPGEHAESLSMSLTYPKVPQWQAMMRERFIQELTGDPDSGQLGRFEHLKIEAIEGCQVRRTELIQQLADLRRARKLWDAIGPGPKGTGNSLALHLSLNLGDRRDVWTLIHGDTSSEIGQDQVGNYTEQVFNPALGVATELADAVAGFDRRPLEGTYDGALFGGVSVDSSGIARLFGAYNLSIRTVMDQLERQGQPYDTPELLDAEMLFSQLRQVAPFLKALADNGKLTPAATFPPSAVHHEVLWDGDKNTGPKVGRPSAGAAMRSHRVTDAVVAIYDNQKWTIDRSIPGFVGQMIYMTDSRGFYSDGPASSQYAWPTRLAVRFDDPQADDPESTELSRGIVRYVSNVETIGAALVTMVKVRSMTIVNYGFHRTGATSVMRAVSASEFGPADHLICEAGQTLTVFVTYKASGVKLFNPGGMVVLNNQNAPHLYEGAGIPLNSLADEFTHPVAAMFSANDLGILNDFRLGVLRDNRINQESLWRTSGQARDLKEDTIRLGPENLTMLKYAADLVVSAALSRRVYSPLMGVMRDLVKAVVLLLLLAMPFAFAMERLIIGTPHIYRQIAWFAMIFLGTFALLYTVNPAFRIAATPIIIFLAFTIILLSSMVIFILIRKLQSEVRRMQGLGATVHSADVSRISTMGAAVMMGISTMRRRPLRTMLTSITVVLLTFTILTFASFGSSYGNRKTYKGPLSSLPPRILVRDPLWSPMDDATDSFLYGHLSGGADVVARVWVSPTAQEEAARAGQSLDRLLTTADTESIVPISAAIGMDIVDLQKQPDIARLFAPDARTDLLEGDGIFVTQAVAKELGLTNADIGQTTLLLAGFDVTYAGIVTDHLASHKTIEGSNIVPVDYQFSGGGEAFSKLQQEQVGGEQGLVERPEIEGAQFSAYGIDRVVVIGVDYARRLGGKTRSVTIYPRGDTADVESIAQAVATITSLPTYYGSSEGVYRLNYTTLTEASGVPDLLIPLILGGLIIFATMLGSVTDREREIYTFSSLGLAPRHVATLFFAEASVYAIIGGMGGYLLGQTVARVLGWVATLESVNISVPDINYSSTTAIVTILIVMGTVLISTIYPAIKASRSANPGIQRSWQIPKPAGDLYDMIFPFTVSAYDIMGVASFLKEHFDNYTDTSLGIFATTQARVFRQKDGDMMGVVADLALAPFDLGINQRFALLSQPSEIEGINEIRILIHRITGTSGDWRRANRVFVNDLRKQLLIWRSLTTEVMDGYRNRTLEGWDSLPQEQVDERTIGDLT